MNNTCNIPPEWEIMASKAAKYDALLQALKVISTGADHVGELSYEGLQMVANAAIQKTEGEG